MKEVIRRNKILISFIRSVRKYLSEVRLYFKTRKVLQRAGEEEKIFYIGIPAHANLGDLAQGVCIRKWLKKHFAEKQVIEIETDALVNTRFSLLPLLQKKYQSGDLVIFQSGYTTTDLGGFADEMHRAVMRILPDARMLMMPQTIFFQSEANRKRTSLCYNKMKNMLFLARDDVSYKMALDMFPDIEVQKYPDIVTTMIGKKRFVQPKEGILFCCRNDSEKYYPDEDISQMMQKCAEFGPVERIDTSKAGRPAYIVQHAQEYIDREIESYSKYKVIVTDRYHGTIFSLVAGTPVIVIKTTDHKVTTGIDWFRGIYDEYVYYADDLNDVYTLVRDLCGREKYPQMQPYFEKLYDELAQKVKTSLKW